MTHAFVGAAISKAGADRATPLATATLVIAANAPDLDVLSYVRGSYFALSFRRGITHGWPALIVLPFLVTAAMLAWDRWVRRRRRPDAAPVRAGPTLSLATVGILTHPTLDWMNTYGMRWALPFDGSWSYGDALFIIDPWIWLTLGGAIFLAARPNGHAATAWATLAAAASALVLIAMPPARAAWVIVLGLIIALHATDRPGTARGGRALATAALGAVVLYVGALVVLDRAARADVALEAGRAGLSVRDVMVSPLRGSFFTSDVEVLTDAGYVPGVHRRVGTPRVELAPREAIPLVAGPESLSAAELDAVIAVARQAPDVRNYLVWSRYPYVRVESMDEGWRVGFFDARYDGELGAGNLGGVQVLVAQSAIP